MLHGRSISWWAWALGLVLAGCGNGASQPIKNEPIRPPGTTTLYERLGGGATIYAIADNLVEKTMSDPNVNLARIGHEHQWNPTPDHVAELKMYWAQYLGMLADGPQLYEGRDMLNLHRGMKISEGEWEAFIADFRSVLARSQITPADQHELLVRVAGTHDAIVDK